MNLNPRVLNQRMQARLTEGLRVNLVNGILAEAVAQYFEECTPEGVAARAHAGGYLKKRSKKLGMCLGIQGANVMESGFPELLLGQEVHTELRNRLAGVTSKKLDAFQASIWPMAQEIMKELAENGEIFADDDELVGSFLRERAAVLRDAIFKIVKDGQKRGYTFAVRHLNREVRETFQQKVLALARSILAQRMTNKQRIEKIGQESANLASDLEDIIRRELMNFAKTMCTRSAAAVEEGVTSETTFLKSIRNIPGDQLWTDFSKFRTQLDRAVALTRFCLERAPDEKVRRQILELVRNPVVPQEVREMIAPAEVADEEVSSGLPQPDRRPVQQERVDDGGSGSNRTSKRGSSGPSMPPSKRQRS